MSEKTVVKKKPATKKATTVKKAAKPVAKRTKKSKPTPELDDDSGTETIDNIEAELQKVENFNLLSFQEHVRSKDMTMGPHDKEITSNRFIWDSKERIEIREIHYPPSALKAFDELLVNASDHFQRCKSSKLSPVKYIDVHFRENGWITVENDGVGLPINKSKEGIWIPEMSFGHERAGSNMKKSDTDIKGGTNGIGAKGTNALSTHFIIDLVSKDHSDGSFTHYKQEWKNGMSDKSPPVITKLDGGKFREYLRVEFLLDYKFYGYKDVRTAYKELLPLFKTRTLMTAVYVGKTCKVSFNEVELPILNSADLAKMIATAASDEPTELITTKIGKSPMNWDLSIIAVPSNHKSKREANQLTIVNGIMPKAGKHVEYIMDTIEEYIKERAGTAIKNWRPSLVFNNIVIVAICRIAKVSWTGQTKEDLQTSTANLKQFEIPKKFMDKLYEILEPLIFREVSDTKTRKKPINAEKYIPAKYAGEKRKKATYLLLPEGDSALATIKKGITHIPKGSKQPLLGFDYFGTLTLGGVIINVRKESQIRYINGIKVFKPSEKLAKNKFWVDLLAVTGLDPTCDYSDEKQLKELRYDYFIICVDQDHDGCGQIAGEILSMFDHVWPNLLKAKRILRFVTPLRRAYPRREVINKVTGQVYHFYNQAEYEDWKKDHNESDYDIKYIKGLGGHPDREIYHMFMNFQENLRAYPFDDQKFARERFEVYFGNDPDKRKKELSIPMEHPEMDLLRKQNKTREITCEDHLKFETKPHKVSNLKQKLWSALDGMNESGRKILYGSIMKFTSMNAKPIKVDQLCGFIMENTNYHHGATSLANSIKGKAFIGVGGIQLPQLLPYGNFGTRGKGGNDASSERYIFTKLNKKLTDLLFPPIDNQLLKYTFDEGVMGEPVCYYPILPTAILESVELPSDGWKISVWARDALEVIRIVKDMIELGIPARDAKLFTHGHTGELKVIEGKYYSYGKYELKKDSVYITELPLRVWSDVYFESMKNATKSAHIQFDSNQTCNYSGDYIDIRFQLNDGAIDKIKEGGGKDGICNPIEKFFNLCDVLHNHLNMIGELDEVIEFKSYDQIINYWFPKRRDLYKKRIDRQLILLELKITKTESLLRYLNDYEKLGLKGVTRQEATKKLLAKGFPAIDSGLLKNPGLTPTEVLKDKILHGEHVDHKYLLKTTDFDRLKTGIEHAEKSLKDLRAEYDEILKKSRLGKFPGAKFWIDELDKLEKVIIEGRNTKWTYGEEDQFDL